MSIPSFENIDRWLFELIEGNLSEEQIQQLEDMKASHPRKGRMSKKGRL